MEPFKRLFLIGVVIAGSAAFTEKSAAADTVSAAEIQHFEQTFENWGREIVANIDPALKFTVIAKISFSQTPEQLQDYEEMKISQHLPGLPEVADPNYSHPLDSPLYALIAKKELKVIFHQNVPARERAVIDEVLRAKMRFSKTDVLAFDSLESNPAVRAPRNAKRAYALLAGTFALGLAFSALRMRQRRARSAAGAKSAPRAARPPAVPAHLQILNAEPSARREALRMNRAEVVAKATLNCSPRFANEVLGELEQDQFDQVNQWILKNRKTVTSEDSNYARILIAAAVQKSETRKFIEKISTFNQRASRPGEVQV